MLKIVSTAMLAITLLLAFAPNLAHGAILPECDPTLFPASKNSQGVWVVNEKACGLYKFGELLQNIIKFLLIVVVPIAFLIIGYAGFKILMSAGNAENVSQAKGMIKIALGGVIILLLSLIIVYAVFNALGVKESDDFKIPGNQPADTPPPATPPPAAR